MMSFADGGSDAAGADSTIPAVSATLMSASAGSVHSLPPTYTYASPAPRRRTRSIATLIQLSHRPDDAVRRAEGIHDGVPPAPAAAAAVGSGSGGGALRTGGPGAVRNATSSELSSSSKLAMASSLKSPACFEPGTRPSPFCFRLPPELSMRLAMERPWDARGDLPMTRTLLPRPARRPRTCGGSPAKKWCYAQAHAAAKSAGLRGEPGLGAIYCYARAMGAGEEVPRPPLDLTPASLSAARSGRRALELYLARYDDRGGESNGGGASPSSSSSSEKTVARRMALPSDRGRAPLDRVDGDAPPGPLRSRRSIPRSCAAWTSGCARGSASRRRRRSPAVAARRPGTCRGGGSSSRSCRGCGPGRRASYSTGTSGPTPSGPPRGVTPRRAARAGAGGTRRRRGSSSEGSAPAIGPDPPLAPSSIAAPSPRTRRARPRSDPRSCHRSCHRSSHRSCHRSSHRTTHRTMKKPLGDDDTAGGGVRDPPSTLGRREAGPPGATIHIPPRTRPPSRGWTRCWSA